MIEKDFARIIEQGHFHNKLNYESLFKDLGYTQVEIGAYKG